jgi:hypothetical protein
VLNRAKGVPARFVSVRPATAAKGDVFAFAPTRFSTASNNNSTASLLSASNAVRSSSVLSGLDLSLSC